jgi:hypothetical protein
MSPRRRGGQLGNQNAKKKSVQAAATGEAERVPVKDRAIALAAAQKARFTTLQIQLLERALAPADWGFDPKTTEDIRALQVDLMHKHLKREISPQDYALQNSGVGNLIKIIVPAPQAPPVDKEAIVMEYVNGQPAELHNANMAYIRKKAQAVTA